MLEVRGVPGVGDDVPASAAGSSGGHPLGGGDELDVELAGDDSTGIVERRRAGPTAAPGCRCRRGAGSGQAVGRVAAAIVDGPGSGSVANSGWAIHRSRNASTPSRSIRAASASSAARRAARSSSSSMPGRGADEHEPLDEVRVGEREVQAQAPAHRVADVRRPAAGRGEQRGAVDEVGADVADPPWPGMSTATTSWSAASVGASGVPRAAGLGEAVDEDEPRTGRRRSSVAGEPVGQRQPARPVAGERGRSTWTNTSGSWAPGTDHCPSITYVGHGGDAGLGGDRELLVDLGPTVVGVEEVPDRRRGRARPRRPGDEHAGVADVRPVGEVGRQQALLEVRLGARAARAAQRTTAAGGRRGCWPAARGLEVELEALAGRDLR